ncbi:MAG TPA: HAMP domain-containing sensor histidine kinase [Nocardioides sp.]|uniref:sensor histidine kinase n=1 Tax=Nocardioides sp. TaxID=35761 RepID=UPI002E307E4A|nr:HAMP domain-containing sensor histidine kinase [Nocardioides sp.]HEX5086257.1 HAMP domain-containing sensor histidine kinase [Nocardioides sp.]
MPMDPLTDAAPDAAVSRVAVADEATSWADAATRDALLVIAEGITQLAGFDVAAVSVVRDSQHMQVMAVAGDDDARDTLLGTFTPIARLMEELDHAEDWGMFKFVPQEALDPEVESWGWVPDIVPLSEPDAWQPLDLLVAPLYGPDGELRGTLSIDCPSDGRRPDEAHRWILNRYAEQAARALYVAVEREAFADQVRVLSATREVVRNATRERNIGVMLEKIQPSLIEGFRCLGSWIHTFDEDGHGLGAIYSGDGARIEMPQHLVAIAERAASESWRAQRVGLVSRHIPIDERVAQVSEPEFEEILLFLEEIGVGSLLFVPVGAGRECLGSLVLTRALGGAEWTPAEVDAALEVGRDLGRAVLNARALDRERELVRELKALDDYKSKLIATLSHELKSPLAAMLANIEFLTGSIDLEPGALDVLAAVNRGASRLVRVVEDLLLLAKVGDPHLPLLTRPVDVLGAVEDVVNFIPLADQPRIKVEVQGDAAAMVAMGDPAEVDILVTNLVSNALKYSDAASTVTVTLSRDEEWVVLACEDQGIGISESDRKQLFREFFRSESAEVKAQAGTGLGLTIVDRIVTRHLGRIEVDSVLGEGSTFRVFLPTA